jgi:hypothetical protein
MTARAHSAEAGAVAGAASLAERVSRLLALREGLASGRQTCDAPRLEPLPADAALRRDLASEIEWRDGVAVPYGAIVGTAHPAYAGRPWTNLLLNGRRMPENLHLLTANPRYYLPGPKPPTMSFVSFDGGKSYFIDADGNHRSCIGRFLGATEALDGVQVTVYRFTPERARLLRAYARAAAALAAAARPQGLLQIDVYARKRSDGAGWKVDSTQVRIRYLLNRRAQAIETADEMEVVADRLEAPSRRWWRWWQ